MKRVGLIALVMMLSVAALSGVGASPASAVACFKIDVPAMETGNFNANCAALTEGGDYFLGTLWIKVMADLWCAKVLPGKTEKTEGWPTESNCFNANQKSAPAAFLRTEFLNQPPGWREVPTTKEKEEGFNGYLQSSTETKTIKLTGSETRFATKAAPVTCKKLKGTGEIIGGTPGTDKSTIKFEECEVAALKCKARNKGGTFGTIEVKANTELVYLTKASAEKSESPFGDLLKTTEKGSKTLVGLEFEGTCSADNGSITATGEEHGPGIQGVAGVVCKVLEPEKEAETHELSCLEKEQTTFFYFANSESTSPSEGKAGLEFIKEKLELVGKSAIALESKEKWIVTPF